MLASIPRSQLFCRRQEIETNEVSFAESNGPESLFFSERSALTAPARMALNGRDLGGSSNRVCSREQTKLDAERCDERPCERTNLDNGQRLWSPVHALTIPFQIYRSAVISISESVPERCFRKSQKSVLESPKNVSPRRRLIQRNLQARRASLQNRPHDLGLSAPEERCVEICSVLQFCCCR